MSAKPRTKSKPLSAKRQWKAFDSAVRGGAPRWSTDHLLHDGTSQNLAEKSACVECGGALRWGESSYLTCTSPVCAHVHRDTLDFSPEWRHFPDDPSSVDMSRCGMPTNPLLEQSSYSCRIVGTRRCSKSFRSVMKYAEWQSIPNREKVLTADFRRITSCAENWNLPKKLIDDAHYFYKQITDDSKKFRGIRREAILAAAVYISCKMNESVRTAVEISQMFYIDLKSAVLGCKNAHAIMSQQEDVRRDQYIAKITPDMMIERFCCKFNFADDLVKLAVFVAKKVEQLHLLTKSSPASVSAGVIYFVAQKCNMAYVTKRHVKQVCDMSEVTINTCHRILCEHADQLIPPAVVARYGAASVSVPPRKRPRSNSNSSATILAMVAGAEEAEEAATRVAFPIQRVACF